MSQQIINISTPDDGLGDALRNGFDKTNQNFTELYNGKVDKITGKGLSKNDFTDAYKAKLDGIEAGAEVNVQADWGETDPLSDSFIQNKPPALYSAFGYFHVADLATQTTPLAFVASTPLQLTNDGGGAFTNYAQAPYGVSDIWDTSRNQFAFAKLSVGDAVLVRTDLLISTTSINQNLRLYIKLGIGTPSEYDLLIDSWNEKSVVSFKHFLKDVSFSIDNEDWRDNPAEIYILSDDEGEVKVNGWYIPIIRKSINVIDLKVGAWSELTNFDALPDADLPLLGTEQIAVVQDGETKKVDLNDFKDIIFGYFNGTNFYTDAGFTTLITPESSKIYVALDTNLQYRWSGSAYVQIGGSSQNITVIAKNVVDSAMVTGTTSDTIVESFVITANTFQPGDILIFECSTFKTGTAGGLMHRHGLTGIAGIFFTQLTASTSLKSQIKRMMIIKSSTVSEEIENTAAVSPFIAQGIFPVRQLRNINWSINQTFNVSIRLGNSSDSAGVSFWMLSRIRN